MTKRPEDVQLAVRRPDEAPTGAEVAALVQALIAKGVPGQELGQMVSSAVSRRENAEAVKDWCRKLPKAK